MKKAMGKTMKKIYNKWRYERSNREWEERSKIER
jgi:hypothetical protein